jgi:hypothetical protein
MNDEFSRQGLEAAFGSPTPYWQSGFHQGQKNVYQYDDNMARSILAQLGNATPYGMLGKPRHIQLLEEAKARHPEWVVKRLTKE